MNPLFRAAADGMTAGTAMGVATLILVVVFTGWTVWAWWPGNRDAMERWARIPLDEDGGGA